MDNDVTTKFHKYTTKRKEQTSCNELSPATLYY